MARRIDYDIAAGAGGLHADIISTHPATLYVLHGTRPHTIRPRRRRALRFPYGARTVFAAVVHHPGTRANNFLMEALYEAF
ncbi:hypothetical protein [Streptomyces sulphureus]|uniref:hypothetical protein n=1 Tax=Streptomyces sulphureus TaxID=47758 RepID=UPI0003A33EF7|nr:hypothetical protein [Streptomyces sulphureus]